MSSFNQPTKNHKQDQEFTFTFSGRELSFFRRRLLTISRSSIVNLASSISSFLSFSSWVSLNRKNYMVDTFVIALHKCNNCKNVLLDKYIILIKEIVPLFFIKELAEHKSEVFITLTLPSFWHMYTLLIFFPIYQTRRYSHWTQLQK